jgi:hypothetical protein
MATKDDTSQWTRQRFASRSQALLGNERQFFEFESSPDWFRLPTHVVSIYNSSTYRETRIAPWHVFRRGPIMFIAALIFGGLLVVLGFASMRRQVINLRTLRAEPHVPSDDRSYLRKRAKRRLVTSFFICVLGGMLAGAFLSGLEGRVDQVLGRNKPVVANGEKPQMTEEERENIRIWAIFWLSAMVLVFVVISLAIVDIVATRRYGWQQLRRIQIENRAILERDLALYRQQKANERMRGAL